MTVPERAARAREAAARHARSLRDAARRAAMRATSAARYQRLRDEGICVRCGEVDARPGRTRCGDCAALDTAETGRRKRAARARRRPHA